MRRSLIFGCLLLLAGPGCNLPPLFGSPEASAAAPRAEARSGQEVAESPPAPPPSLSHRVEQGAGRIGTVLADGYVAVTEGLRFVGDSALVSVLLFPVAVVAFMMRPVGCS
jgi:hypothetical protein